jgi:hypothetical protein
VTAAKLWMLSCVVGGALFAQPSLRITSPPDGSVINPGRLLKVTVQASGAFMQVTVISGDPIGFTKPLLGPPYESQFGFPTVSVPENTR